MCAALATVATASASSAQLSDASPPGEVGASAPAANGEPPGSSTGDAGAAPARPPSPQQGPVIVVTGHKLEEDLTTELVKYGTRVETIAAESIRNAGQPDVAKSLETLAPGLYLSPKNGPFDYVDVSYQGSRTQDILWLLDGVRLNNRLYGGTTPLDTFPASIVERIEILDGPEALFFGTQAVAGAIDIVTRPFSERPEGALALGGDSTGGRHLDAYFRTSIARHRFVVYGSADQSNGFQSFRDQDYQPSATSRRRGYEVLTLGAKYAYDFTPDLRFAALYQLTGARLDFAKPFLVASAYNARDEHVATAKLDYEPSEEVRLFAKAYLHLWSSHYTEFDNVVGSPGSASVVDNDDFWGYRDYGANLVVKLAPSRWLDAFVGYDLQSYAGNDAVLVITRKTESVNAVFAQLRTPDRPAMPKLAVGIRYNVPTVGPAAAVWDGTGRYDFGDAVTLRGTVGTAFRLPTAEELFANDPDDERGDPNLRPERSFNINLSVGGRGAFVGLPGLSWEAIGFYRQVTDLISASGFDAATDQSLFENTPGTVRVRGTTLLVEGPIAQAWSGSASYTYASSDQAGGPQIDKVPRQQAKGWVDWHPPTWPIGGAVFVHYVGDVFQSFGAGDRERIPRHAVLDLSARVFLDADRRHRIDVGLSNVTGAVYATSLGKGVRDADGSEYTYWNLGTPRTLSLRYGYRF
jgi:vitamin B12 transporter